MPQIPFYAKEWREFRDLSIKEAARLSGMKLSHLTALESRDHHFDEHDLAALSNAYKIHPAMFLNLNPADPKDRQHLEMAMNAANFEDEED